MLNLLEELKDKNIHISVKDNNLVIDTTEDIEESLIKRIRVYKEEIISYILKHNSNSIAKHTSTGEDHPVSDAQKRLWLQSLTEEGSKSYHINFPIEFPSSYDPHVVKLAVLQLIKNFEIFRTVFHLNDQDEVRQIILEENNAALDVEIIDLKREFADIRSIADLVKNLNSQAFDLGKGPLLRCKIFELKDKIVTYFIFHHIIIDGVSLNVVKQNILSYYHAIVHSEEISGPKLQYLDYTYWKLAGINNGNYNAAQRYWTDLLSKKISTIDLPSYAKRPSVKTFNSYTLKTVISSELTQKLDAFAKQNMGTLNVSLLSAVYVLLNKYTSENDITLGTFTSGRNHPSLNEMPGLFVNTIVLNNILDQKDTLTDTFRKVKDSFTKAFTHQDYPFDLLIEDLHLSQDTSRNPLFDITVVFQDYLDNESGEVYSDEIEEIGFTKRAFDINFEFINKGSFLEMIVAFNADIYDKGTIISFINHFRQVLQKFVSAADVPLRSLDYISAEEKIALDSFNHTKVDYPSDETIVSLFEKQVLIAPDHTAVIYGGVSLSYSELNARANQLAYYLREKFSIKGDDLICIQLSRSEKMLVSILGILKSGAAYVPISQDYPQDRTDYILSDTRAKVNINESFLLEFESCKDLYSKENQESVIRQDHLAYIIYTSGTTGNPKGVMIQHGSLVNRLMWMQSRYPLADKDVLIQKTPYTFDVSVWELLWWCIYGATLSVPEQGAEKDPSLIIETIERDHVSIIHFVPSMFTAFLNHIDTYPEEKQKLTSLKTVFTSGEALSVYQKEFFYRLFPENISLVNLYGPTEACIDVTYYDCKKDIKNTIIPIGKPIDNTQMYVLDDANGIVPIGVTGELYISGDGLARGYLNRVDLTAEKFVENPFIPGAKMYRTGDLGRWLADGTIEYLGRIDHQVKIRGHRIELGEIDNQVLSFSESIKSVVTEVKEHEEDKSLVVYYISDTPIDKQDLTRHLESKLPKYMLPGFYVELDQIPLTSNGKVDRKSLPEVSSEDLITTEYVAATSKEEKVLVSVCEQVLKHSPISIRDNYYNLGGDSIKSIQIVSRLRQQGYSLKVEHILQYPVLEELARYMTTDVAKIDQSEVTGESILTPIQRYFFESEGITNKNHYNQSVILKSRERLSEKILESSLKTLVSHHDALRMVYSKKEGKWNQYNSGIDGVHYRLAYFDIRESGSESEELSQLQQIGEDLQSTINIESGVLFHVGHVSMSDGDRIILVVHHLVMDGVSWRILLEDLGKLYESGVQGLSSDLPSKTDSFQSWGKALDEYSRSLELSKERLYWEGVESENYAPLATDYPVEGKQVLDKSLGFSLSTDATKLLQTRAGRKYSAEINDVLLTGLALALQNQFGVSKTKVLMEGHGREVMSTGLDISRTIGWFTSVYPFNLDISDNSQPALVSVKEGLRSIPNKGIGYGILRDLKKEIDSQSIPSVLFNYLGDFNEEGDKKDDATQKFSLFRYSSENIGSSVDPSNLSTDILFDVSGMTVNGEMNISIRYSTKVFKEGTIENLSSAYKTNLEAIVRESEDSSVILTPSDLTYKELSFNTITEISVGHEIEDIYELSPMQQGLYFHWLMNTKGSAYFVQTSYRVKSVNLDLSLVEQAFGMLLNRYTILRTSFENRYGEVPLQIVHKKARVDFRHLILESEIGLDNIKQEDINQGFILNKPTQMRLVVVELPDDYYEFIWSHHHIVMDGWCLSILINDFAAILQSLQQETILSLPEVEKYSSYIQWLKNIDKDEVLAYWEDYLQGKDSPTLIPFAKEFHEDTIQYDLSSHISFVDKDVYKEIVQFCKNSGITLNTYIQAVWSYLLSAYNDFEEVTFGAVVSGRPPEVLGIESMVGLFINTVPVRVAINKDETPQILLDKMHRESIGSTKYHYLNLAEIQNKSTLKRNLINHILIFENFLMAERSVDPENDKDPDSIKIEKSKFQLQTTYPFNFEVFPTDEDLRILVDYNKNVFDDYSVVNIVRVFKEILAFFKENINVPFAEINDELEKQSIYFKAIRQKDIKEIVNTTDSDVIKQKNSNKLSAFIKNKKQ